MTGPAILDLPASVTLAVWLPHVADTRSARLAAHAVTGTDEPHQIVEHPTEHAAGTLAELLEALVPVPEVAAVLPRPGDLMGAPALRSADLVDAGEGVLLRRPGPGARERCGVLVPTRTFFGNPWEPGEMVTWTVDHDLTDHLPAPSLLLAGVDSMSQARRDIQLALTQAVAALEELEVARDRPDLAEHLLDLSVATFPDRLLPDRLDPRRLEVLERAARLYAIVELAVTDDGGARTAGQAEARRHALRGVDRAARHALAAASATRLVD